VTLSFRLLNRTKKIEQHIRKTPINSCVRFWIDNNVSFLCEFESLERSYNRLVNL